MSIYNSWTIEDAKAIGKKFKAMCRANYNYERVLKEGRSYEITIEPRILPASPLCSFVGEDGREGECHLLRFTKVEEINEHENRL